MFSVILNSCNIEFEEESINCDKNLVRNSLINSEKLCFKKVIKTLLQKSRFLHYNIYSSLILFLFEYVMFKY